MQRFFTMLCVQLNVQNQQRKACTTGIKRASQIEHFEHIRIPHMICHDFSAVVEDPDLNVQLLWRLKICGEIQIQALGVRERDERTLLLSCSAQENYAQSRGGCGQPGRKELLRPTKVHTPMPP